LLFSNLWHDFVIYLVCINRLNEKLNTSMKKRVLFLSVLVGSLFGFNAGAQEIIAGPAISVDKETHDYGNIAYDANGECEFTITNTGTEDLIISGAKGSCGCTVPTYPKEPIAPGKSATIKVTYDTKRPGSFKKSVTITSNAVNEPSKIVYIQGNVGPKPEGAAPVAPAVGPTAAPSTVTPPTTNRPGSGSATLITPR
jgi:hypothetical protein